MEERLWEERGKKRANVIGKKKITTINFFVLEFRMKDNWERNRKV